MASSLWLVFVGGLLGSAHCFGMCGPLVALAESLHPGRWTPWRQLVLHAGRLFTYGVFGAVAGLAGWAIERGGVAAGIQNAAGFLGGAAMILFALALFDRVPWPWGRRVSNRAVERISSALVSRGLMSGFLIGVYWGLLPCGLVWAFLPRAAAAGSATGGIAAMLAFGAGTVPALLVLGGVAGFVGARQRQWLGRLGAATVAAMGLLLILRAAAAAGWLAHFTLVPGIPLF